jgi:hypothetical protein
MTLKFDADCDSPAALGPSPGLHVTDQRLRQAFRAVDPASVHHDTHRRMIRRAQGSLAGDVWVRKHTHQDTVTGGVHAFGANQRTGGFYNIHCTVRDVKAGTTYHVYVQPYNGALWIRGITDDVNESFDIRNS